MTSSFATYPDRIFGLNGLEYISANEVLQTGEVIHTHQLSDLTDNHRMDLTSNDAFSRAYQEVYAHVISALRQHPILVKPEWNREDRAAWEALASTTIRRAMRQQDLFAEYRTNGSISSRTGRIVTATHDLNELRIDSEFDCDKMSTIMATMLQKAEAELLPANTSVDNWRRQGQYYLAIGILTELDRGYAESSRHGWVTSSATGNVIDATGQADTYRMSAQADYSFEHAIAGYPAIVRRAVLTSHSNGTITVAPASDAKHELYHQGFTHEPDALALAARRLSSLRRGEMPPAPAVNRLTFDQSFGADKNRLGALLNSNTTTTALQYDYRPTEADGQNIVPKSSTQTSGEGYAHMLKLWNEVTDEQSACRYLLTAEEINSLREEAKKHPQAVTVFEHGTRTQGGPKAADAVLVIEAGKVLLYNTQGTWRNDDMNRSFPSDQQCERSDFSAPPRKPGGPTRIG